MILWRTARFTVLTILAGMLVAGCASRKKTTTIDAHPTPPPVEVSYKLQFRATPNTSATYRMKVQSQFIQEVMGAENVIDTGWSAVLTQRVGTPDVDGNIAIDIRFDSMAVDLSNPMLAPMLKPLQDVAGKSLQAIVATSGEVKKLHGLEDLPAAANQNNQMENTLRNMFPRFTDRSIKIGESWSRNDTTHNKSEAIDMKIINHSQYSLVSAVGAANATQLMLHNTNNFSLSGIAKNQGMDVGLNGSGTAEGDFTVEYATGRLIAASATSESSGSAEVNMGQPMSIPWRSNTIVTITRK